MRTTTAALLACLWLATSAQASPQVVSVGDSLGVGTSPYLAQQLKGTARLTWDARVSRPSTEGVPILDRLVTKRTRVVIFDLGTNDWSPSTLEDSLLAARRISKPRPMILATINGPFAAANNPVLRAFAKPRKQVSLVRWRLRSAGHLGPDRMHATASGYNYRASLFARAVKRRLR